jgi:hypothetical protein
MCRKCTLKIFLREPNYRITSGCPDQQHFETVPWQIQSVIGVLPVEMNFLRLTTVPGQHPHPGSLRGTPGS